VKAARIAAQLKRHSDYLRSRASRRRASWEGNLLCELDVVEAQARALSVQEALGSVPVDQAAVEEEALALAAMELRERFHRLLDRERGRGGRRG